MIIVDSALKKLDAENRHVKVGVIGAGFIGQGLVICIEKSVPGMKVSAICNRTIIKAREAYEQAGITDVMEVDGAIELDAAIDNNRYVITNNPFHLCESGKLDVIIEATGDVEYGARVTMRAIDHGKDVVLMNAELDATIGPILKTYADDKGVLITNTDGDQPGVLMNLFRFVDMIGYKPLLMGNIKGLQDPYRTPETQKEFARKHKQKPKMVTSFADGTKISMEMAVVANATGFKTKKRGMYGPECGHVKEAINHFSESELLDGGMVDYILGAEPGPGVFIIAYNDDPILKGYANYLKMGDGPLYTFYVPYHLPHLEVASTAARAVLFDDAVIAPAGPPVCEVITIAKKNLKAGEKLDGIGGFTAYGTLENSSVARKEDLLPMGLSENCVLKRDIKKDQAISFSDINKPEGRLCDRLWDEQQKHFDISQER